MNEKQVNPIEIDRQKSRILNGLEAAFHHVTVKEGKILILEAKAELEDYEKRIYGVEPPTVQSVLQDLYDCNKSADITMDDQPNTFTDYQYLINLRVELLANLLGVELEG